MVVGIGQARQADYVAIDWSDGVFQTESALEASTLHRLTETQRQLASCPVVFMHDGSQYRFVTDILGVGGIGFNLGNGSYATPRPWENIVLPHSIVDMSSSEFRLKISEPMEEIAYIDAVELWAVDVPPGYAMALNERLATAGPQPDGAPVLYQHVHALESAVVVQGNETLVVTSPLLDADLDAVPVGEIQPQFAGLLQDELVVELHWGRDLSAIDEPALLIDGWVEYGYSQTSFAAWQAGLEYDALSLDYLDSDGRWTPVHRSFGYPAGMPRSSMLKLETLPPGTQSLRIRTHQQIYLDRIVMVETDSTVTADIHRLKPSMARVTQEGFARRSTGEQYQPHYDDRERQPFWDTRYPAGFYTRFGESTELVLDRDNALAVIGPGDSIELTFDNTFVDKPEGMTRYLVMSSHGWAKDMDLYTRDGETVGPMPKHDSVSVDRADLYHPLYNTRYQSGR